MTQARQLASSRSGSAAIGPSMQRQPTCRLLPGDDRDRLLELRHLEGERAVGVEAEGAAVEDQLVLAAALVDVDQRQAGLDDAGERDLLADVGLALPVGRAVRARSASRRRSRAGTRETCSNQMSSQIGRPSRRPRKPTGPGSGPTAKTRSSSKTP